MTTFDRLMMNLEFKSEFDKSYNDFLISEFLIEKMEEEHMSVRELAKKANVSPTTIQHIRNGKSKSVRFETITNVLEKLGYILQPVKVMPL